MAVIKCDFFSEVLSISTSMTVILPQPNLNQGIRVKKYPTLYLLHGFSDDHTAWTRRTSIERYVENLGIAVVMPQVDHSYYTDMEYGKKYWTFLSEELPQVAQSFFPLSDLREENYVAGLSMGGYGALKWALRQPNRFAAAASLSGALDIVKCLEKFPDDRKRGFYHIFGDKEIKGTENDLFWLIEQADTLDTKPLLYQCCGTEDFLYEDNLQFYEKVKKSSFDLTIEFSSGSHDWLYWDEKIQNVLKWLPIKQGEK
ncbi:alpha/beta hydrolase [Paraliobacillus sp. JSM ZJ581]|uniref:alpha/beta hydrolase n=1 Tax=Paraliobacillus sp. JSM ZJ581 TaxID=3342118 RepID=UPI0035A8D453